MAVDEKLNLRTVQSKKPWESVLTVFRNAQHARREIHRHFLNAAEKWYQVARPRMEDAKAFLRTLGGAKGDGQNVYERYFAAIERNIQSAERHGFWQGWQRGSISTLSPDQSRSAPVLDCKVATWVSLEGVRVNAIGEFVTEAIRHTPSSATMPRASDKTLGTVYHNYLCFLVAHETVRVRAMQPSMWKDAMHRGVTYYEEKDDGATSGMFEKPWMDSKKWLKMWRDES